MYRRFHRDIIALTCGAKRVGEIGLSECGKSRELREKVCKVVGVV